MIEIFVVIKDGTNQYYLLKIQKRGSDVYFFPPRLGVHYSLHESGEAHFQPEMQTSKPRETLPVIMFNGEAGTPSGKGIEREQLADLGRASCMYATVYSIDSLSKNFQKFNRSSVEECFVINKDLFSKDIKSIEIGVWAVPARNKVSFEFNNPDIPEDLLYRVTSCEPQIWTYARPF